MKVVILKTLYDWSQCSFYFFHYLYDLSRCSFFIFFFIIILKKEQGKNCHVLNYKEHNSNTKTRSRPFSYDVRWGSKYVISKRHESVYLIFFKAINIQRIHFVFVMLLNSHCRKYWIKLETERRKNNNYSFEWMIISGTQQFTQSAWKVMPRYRSKMLLCSHLEYLTSIC